MIDFSLEYRILKMYNPAAFKFEKCLELLNPQQALLVLHWGVPPRGHWCLFVGDQRLGSPATADFGKLLEWLTLLNGINTSFFTHGHSLQQLNGQIIK